MTPDNRWWGVLATSGDASTAPGVHLYELVDHAWRPRLRLPGSDAWEKADVEFDGSEGTLLIALRDNQSLADNPSESKLYRLSYRGGGEWDAPTGPFPITAGANPETLTLAKDSAGRVWAGYSIGKRIRLRYTSPGGTSFSSLTLPVSDVTYDDIAVVTAFRDAEGSKIGVMWSDQASKQFRFAWRHDGDPPTTANWHYETPYGGGAGGCPTASSDLCSDDHVSLKTYNGQIYAAVKTS